MQNTRGTTQAKVSQVPRAKVKYRHEPVSSITLGNSTLGNTHREHDPSQWAKLSTRHCLRNPRSLAVKGCHFLCRKLEENQNQTLATLDFSGNVIGTNNVALVDPLRSFHFSLYLFI